MIMSHVLMEISHVLMEISHVPMLISHVFVCLHMLMRFHYKLEWGNYQAQGGILDFYTTLLQIGDFREFEL